MRSAWAWAADPVSTADDAARAAVHDLVARYAAAVDDRRFDVVADLFTDDAVLLAPDPPTALGPTVAHDGPAAIGAAMAALAGFTATFHAVHGVVVDLSDNETATGRVTCTAHHMNAGGDRHRDLVWHLVYRDTYRHTGAGWRFARRELRIISIDTANPRAVGPTVDTEEEPA